MSAPRPEAVALVAGTATRDGEPRRFVAVATREDVLHSASEQPEVPGCPLDGGPMDVDGTMRLEVQLRVWLDQVDFEQVAVADDGEAVELEAGAAPHNAFVRGVQKAAAYRFHYEAT